MNWRAAGVVSSFRFLGIGRHIAMRVITILAEKNPLFNITRCCMLWQRVMSEVGVESVV
jgi:hypothetical protein